MLVVRNRLPHRGECLLCLGELVFEEGEVGLFVPGGAEAVDC